MLNKPFFNTFSLRTNSLMGNIDNYRLRSSWFKYP